MTHTPRMNSQSLRKALQIQRPKLAYQFGCGPGTGLCADLTKMMTHLLTCLEHGYGFALGKVSRPKNFCVRDGWNDLFLPFCEETQAPGLQELNSFSFKHSPRRSRLKPILRSWLSKTTKPTCSHFMFDDLPKIQIPLSAPIFHENESFFPACKKILDIIYSYNQRTQQNIYNRLQSSPLRLNGKSSDYAAIHIRRGDKITEHDYVPASAYIQYLRCLNPVSKFVFVASDESTITKELQDLAPELDFRSLNLPTSRGYNHKHFSSLPEEKKLDKIYDLLAEIEICRDAQTFLGSNTTNVSIFIKMLRGGNCCHEIENRPTSKSQANRGQSS